MIPMDVPTIAAFALTVLVNGLWQAALLAGAAWLVLRTARRANATTRHAVLVAALVGGLVLPIVTTAIAFTHAAQPSATTTVTAAERSAPAFHTATRAVRHTKPSATPIVNVEQPARRIERAQFTLPGVALLTIVGLWLFGALVLIARLGFSLLYLERLKHDALPLPIEYRARLERWDAAGKGARDVRLCRSSEIAVPIAVGIFDAMILVPERLLEDLPSEDLDRILLHELAHLRRGDDWLNALERTLEALLYFNPGIRWLNRQLDVEREVACDDWVLERRSEALPYAQCLVKLVEGVSWPYQPIAAPGVFVTRRSISIRIERLLAKQRDVRLRISPVPLASLAGIAVLACILGAYISPSFAAGVQPGPSIASQTGTALARRPSVRAATHARTEKQAPRIVSLAQPASTPSSEPTPLPATSPSPSPAVLRTAIPVAIPALRAAGAGSQTHVHTEKHTNVASPSVSAGDVVHQVAALSNAESATPSPAMTGEDFIADMAAAGYTNLSVDDLIKLKSLGVSGAYVREMQAAGLGHPPVHELAEMRAVGVTPQFAGDMRRSFPSVSVSDIVSMRAVGVTSSYVADLRSAGVKQLTAESVRGMRALGVDAAYVRQLAAAGYANLSAEQLGQLRAVGVDAAFLKKVRDHGFHNLSLDDLVRLKTSGVLFQ